MPSSWNLRLLARTLRPVSLVFAQPLESSLQLAPSISTPRHRSRGLFRSSLRLPCGLRLSSRSTPPAWTPGLSILQACALPDPPCDWTSSAFGLRRSLLLSSPLVLPRRPLPLNPGLRLHSVFGSSVPSWFLRTTSSGAFQIALPLRACALCFRSILRPAFRFGLRLAPSARPSSCLRCAPPDLRPSAHPPAPPRACRLFMTLGLRLVPCRPAPFESSQRPTACASILSALRGLIPRP
jgi:hypothetical protein